jgi:hypothetical protein
MMRISGGAGTGKTYLIAEMADNLLKYQNKQTMHTVAVTATTNKAAAVIADAMPHRAQQIQTTYSFMNLRVQENFKTGAIKVIPTANWEVHSGHLIIVDECSMVNQALFDYLMKGTDSTCKIIFVGDENQLSPVKENISPVYTTNMPSATLTMAVRNANQQALMDVCEQAKQTVLTGVFTPIVEVPGVIDFVDGTTAQGIVEREFRQQNSMKRIICYTNQRVIQYNSFIRDIRSYVKAFEVGEILINNTTVELSGKERLYTDQVLEVIKVSAEYISHDIIKGETIPMISLTLRDISTLQEFFVDSFQDPNDRTAVLKYYSGSKNWEPYFRIKKTYADLRSISASTTHKAQGSTFDTVIVDLADIGKSTNKEQTARLQYVALSRPKSHLIIRGQLPGRYFK